MPFRDSKLTPLLKDSLGGNCHTMMIANISPSGLAYKDTYNTLKCADWAKEIRLTVCAGWGQGLGRVMAWEGKGQDSIPSAHPVSLGREERHSLCSIFGGNL